MASDLKNLKHKHTKEDGGLQRGSKSTTAGNNNNSNNGEKNSSPLNKKSSTLSKTSKKVIVNNSPSNSSITPTSSTTAASTTTSNLNSSNSITIENGSPRTDKKEKVKVINYSIYYLYRYLYLPTYLTLPYDILTSCVFYILIRSGRCLVNWKRRRRRESKGQLNGINS